jgi:ribosomal protein S18 acetylase RimI-like enzyme
VSYRSAPRPQDGAELQQLVEAIDQFYPAERVVAAELIDERLSLGEKCGYHFVFADRGGALIGYTAWGLIPMTRSSYDLYWIAVHPEHQGLGVGQELMRMTEHAVAERGGGRLYVETSARDDYVRTREFYERAGYKATARFDDFYADGDAKIVYCKVVAATNPL